MAVINFDFSLIGAYLTSQANLRSGTAVPSLLGGPLKPKDRGPAVIPPWKLTAAKDSLAASISRIRGLHTFIDPKASSVLKSNGDDDSKKLFTLFNAITDLQTLAKFAASKNATAGTLKALDAKLQSGIKEVRSYLQATTFDKPLDILFGTKTDNVVSQAGLGKFQTDHVGAVIHSGNRDTPVAGLTGTEKFTISLSKGTLSDNIVIDLSLMTTPLTVPNIGKFINDTIAAITDLDVNGNPVPRYATRFNTETTGTSQFGFRIKIAVGETVTLSAADTQPSLLLAGSRQVSGTSNVKTGFVNKLNGIAGTTPSFGFSRTIAAGQPGEAPKVFDLANLNKQITSIPLAQTESNAVATDANGNTYVVGATAGDFGSYFNRAASKDVFLSKFDAAGVLVYQRLLGAEAQAEGFAITLDSQNNVIVSGKSTANLTATAVVDNPDSFVTKFDSLGNEKFTYQVQSGANDGALAVTVDANDDILIAGFADGQIDATQTNAGGRDAFFTKLSGLTGTVLASHQFGTAGADTAAGIAIAADGNILVASTENDHAVLRKFDATTPSTQIFSVDLGALNGGSVTGLSVNGTAVYVAGSSANGALAGTTVTAHSGGIDGFVSRIDDSGASATANFTTFIGAAGNDRIRAIAGNGGNIYVAGNTDGTLPGATPTGNLDGFAAKINGTTGATDFVKQFGSPSSNFDVAGIAFAAEGSSSLTALGLPTGKIDTTITRSIVRQTTVRAGDQFLIQINGGAKRKITVDKGDSFIALANKIKRLSFLHITARTSSGANGPRLFIEGQRGATIDILSGPKGKDALLGLGIVPTRLFNEVKPKVVDPNVLDLSVGGVFGLQLNRDLNLRGKAGADFAVDALDLAAGIVQKAFRSLNKDPAVERAKLLLAKQKGASGPVPPQLAKQLANFQAGLARLGQPSTTFGFF